MRSHLAPVLANIFMRFHQSKWLNECNLNKPKFYFRYVDDILSAFDNEQYNFVNNMHPNIKSTTEKQLSIPSLFIVYSFQVSILKISHFKHITNRPIQDFS